MISLIWILLIVYCVIFKKKLLYDLYILLILGIPYNTKLYEIIGLRFKGVSICDLILGVLFLITLLRIISEKGMTLHTFDIIIVTFFMVFIIGVLLGKINNNLFFKSECLMYIRLFLTYLVYRVHFTDKIVLKKSIQLVIYSVVIYSLFCIIIYYKRDIILPIIYSDNLKEWWGATRIAFSNASIILFLPLFLNNSVEKSRIKRVIMFILMVIIIILSQSRALMLGIAFIYFCKIIFRFLNKRSFIYLVILSISFYLGLAAFFANMDNIQKYMLNSRYEVIQRLSKLLDDDYKENNVRYITNSYYMNEIKGNKMGMGIGKDMNLFDSNRDYASNGIFIDNLPITLMYKFGWVVVFPIIWAMLYLLKYIYLKLRTSLKVKLDILCTGICSFLICGVINAQVIYSLPVSTFIILAVLMLLKIENKHYK